MSRGRNFARFNAGARAALTTDVGPVDEASAQACGCEPCDLNALFRVPWPHFGGDVAYCGYHLARYRAEHPDLFRQVADAFPCLGSLTTRGDRFVDLDEVPPKIRAGYYRRVGLDQLGHAIYESVEPDANGRVLYLEVDRTLDYQDARRVDAEQAGTFLRWLDDHRGIYAWDPDVHEALYGSGGEGR